ncbi:MAG: Gfo/Idh/MocA family protein [Candidatus Sumerlaeota bacterium]
MSDKLQLGIIGCGAIGKTHATAAKLLPDVQIAAVADLDRKQAEIVAKQCEVGRICDSGEDILDDPDIDAVILALPAVARTKLCLHAFEQGKHVLNEKPMAMNMEEIKQLLEAKGDLVAASCTSRMRHTESVKAAADFIATGALGDLRVLRVRALIGAVPPDEALLVPWRYKSRVNAGGIMSNWGCYDLDTMLGVLDWKLRPESVLGQTWTVQPDFVGHIAPGSDGESHVSAMIKCAGGVSILFERGELVPRSTETAWEITGTGGTLHLRIVPGEDKKLLFDRADPQVGIETQTVWEGGDDWDTIHVELIADFVRAIRTGRPPATTFEQAAVVQRITHAIYDSSATGKPIILD